LKEHLNNHFEQKVAQKKKTNNHDRSDNQAPFLSYTEFITAKQSVNRAKQSGYQNGAQGGLNNNEYVEYNS